MTSFFLKLCGLLALGAFGFWWIGRGLWRARRSAREIDVARQAFSTGQHRLEQRLLDAVNQTRESEELRWKQVVLLPSETLLARDVATGELYALAWVEISLESDDTIGRATAVFLWRGGQWASEGRVVPDLEPQETLRRHSGSLVAV